jgi:hypothetical protein
VPSAESGRNEDFKSMPLMNNKTKIMHTLYTSAPHRTIFHLKISRNSKPSEAYDYMNKEEYKLTSSPICTVYIVFIRIYTYRCTYCSTGDTEGRIQWDGYRHRWDSLLWKLTSKLLIINSEGKLFPCKSNLLQEKHYIKIVDSELTSEQCYKFL